MSKSNLEVANKTKKMKKNKMLKILLNELEKVSYASSYDLSMKISNSPTGISRYLESLVTEGVIRFVQKINENRLVKYYYIPKNKLQVSKFNISGSFIDLLGWKKDQVIYLHMETVNTFRFSASKESSFFTFGSLPYTLRMTENTYFIILPENFLYFYQINGSQEEFFSVNEEKTFLTYSVPREEFSIIPNLPKKYTPTKI